MWTGWGTLERLPYRWAPEVHGAGSSTASPFSCNAYSAAHLASSDKEAPRRCSGGLIPCWLGLQRRTPARGGGAEESWTVWGSSTPLPQCTESSGLGPAEPPNQSLRLAGASKTLTLVDRLVDSPHSLACPGLQFHTATRRTKLVARMRGCCGGAARATGRRGVASMHQQVPHFQSRGSAF